MATYVIGDVQGCYQELQALLEHIQYNPSVDSLWFCGDLVNRGPASLATLRFIKNLQNCIVVLGNHDLHLLALGYASHNHFNHTLQDILTAPDKEELLTWLRQQPLMHYDNNFNCIMAHAGISPQWTCMQARMYAKEVEAVLIGENYIDFLRHMYGNLPAQWNESLVGYDRLRCIVNYFTRMRFCDAQAKLDLQCKNMNGTQPAGYLPWFEWPNALNANEKIVFGHWAALNGKTSVPHVFAVDTGCVWGGSLTALRLEDNQRFSVACTKFFT